MDTPPHAPARPLAKPARPVATSAQARPYQALTFEICDALAGLAQPTHSTGLTPALYQQAAVALNAARADAMTLADRQPLAAAQDTIRFALALTAAIATLERLITAP